MWNLIPHSGFITCVCVWPQANSSKRATKMTNDIELNTNHDYDVSFVFLRELKGNYNIILSMIYTCKHYLKRYIL